MAPVASKIDVLSACHRDNTVVVVAIALLALTQIKPAKKKRKHRFWVHEILKKRLEQGAFRLATELVIHDSKFKEFLRLTREQFAVVLHLIEGDLERTSSVRVPISPRERLTVCLRYLATGESYRSLAFQFRIGVTTVSRIVAEVCEVLWIHLSPDYLAAPSTSYDWLLVAENFEKKWQFPHCLGSLDGKHVVMKAPGNSGSLYFNYKGTFSLVLMALVDANLRFLAVDIGAYGRNSDGGVLSRSSMGRAFSKNALNFPEDSPLPGAPGLGKLPYVILADEAFPLTTYMMRPFPGKRTSLAQKCFNYRLSRGRRIVENAFGVLAARWRVFHTKIAVQPATARSIVKATLVLHNMLQAQTTPAQVTCLLEEVRGVPIQGLVSIQRTGNRGARQGVQVRELYMDYFTKYCPVPWQLNHVQRGSLGLDDQ